MSDKSQDYLARALEAEGHAADISDPAIKCSLLNIAASYRDLARFAQKKAAQSEAGGQPPQQSPWPSAQDESHA